MQNSETTNNKSIQYAMLVGGYSLIAFVLFKVLGITKLDSSTTWFVFYAGFFVNLPHFLVSYHLLYWEFKKKIFSNYRFVMAAVIVPISLLLILSYIFYYGPETSLGYLANAMYFFVGWHYIKQVFGAISVFNVKKNIYYTYAERLSLKGILYSLWLISWTKSNTNNNSYFLEGIPYSSLNIPTEALDISYIIFIGFLLFAFILAYKKYIKEGKIISIESFFALLAMCVWFIPLFYNKLFLLVIPFFHSLQYLVFVWLFKHNQVNDLNLNSMKDRKLFLHKFVGFMLLPILTGSVVMWFLPQFLDNQGVLTTSLANAKPIMFSMTVFINIHHYFIDHAIWRKDNEEVKRFLFASNINQTIK